MNRPIKFRAWDKTNNKMSVQYGFTLNLSGEIVTSIGWEVMQFTGLLDKQGKEIYEGDIIKTIWGGDKKITGRIIWGEGFVGWGIESKGFEYRISATAQMERKIIGNVFENPKLLKTE
jgi:uncharacterized phage protein (TIGR01671 family)